MIAANKGFSLVSSTDRRNRYRIGKCGKYERSAESIARQKAKLAAFWGDPENRRRHSELTTARMARPGVSEKIAAAVRIALADPETKERHIAGLRARFADPSLREKISTTTKLGMQRWRAWRLEEAAIVLRQLPRAEREEAMASLARAAHGTSKQ
jgi:hypothetical protein